jgi:DNA-binding NtrC family response regulator
MPHALIIDDDPGFTPALAEFVKQQGFVVATAATLNEARAALAAGPAPDVMLVDLILPDGSGLDLIREHDTRSETQIVVMTAHASVDTTIQSLRARVFDFLIKPLDVERLRACLDALRSGRDRPAPSGRAVETEADMAPFGILVGASEQMHELYNLVQKVAPSDATVLLQGESGTGKELVAQAIHKLSSRKANPFLALNCGAVAPTLIGTELFGHERGSFTGASRQHKGYFERAAGGTLLLDEVTEMPLELQVQLLRVLETGMFVRIGGSQELPTDARVIAATNRAPEEAVTEGKLRADLLFRLMVFPIRLPPLRERPGDIERLAGHFLRLLNEQQGADKYFTPEAIRRLKIHQWPGNVRELRNAVQRAFILAENEIRLEHFGDWLTSPNTNDSSLAMTVGMSIEDAERKLILATLEQFDGDKPLAADALGISLKTLYNRVKQYGL